MSHLQFISDFKKKECDQKPREKMYSLGTQALQPWELLAILMRTGERHTGGYFEDVEQLSRRILSEGGFKGIFSQFSVEEIVHNFGIYPSHAQSIAAVSEVVRRMNSGFDVFDASTAERIFQRFQHLQSAKQEQCYVLHVNSNKKCIHQEMVAMGSTSSVSVTPNAVIRSALWLNASQIIVVHNHLGDPHPSPEDIVWTTALSQGFWDMFQITLCDHVIVGTEGFFSFQEKNLL